MNWEDRVPTYPNRYKIVKEDGSFEYVTLERADEPTVEGTPINAVNMNALEETIVAALTAAGAAQTSADGKVSKAGDTMAGDLQMASGKGLMLPTKDGGYVKISYRDSNDSIIIARYDANSEWMNSPLILTPTGAVSLNADPTAAQHAATKQYADTKMPKSGGTFTGDVKAYSDNRLGDSLRNIAVRNASDSGVSTNRIIMKRK